MSTLALWREKLGYQPLSLGIIAMITSAALAFGNHATHDDILFSPTKTPEILVKQARMLRDGRQEIVIENYQPSAWLRKLLGDDLGGATDDLERLHDRFHECRRLVVFERRNGSRFRVVADGPAGRSPESVAPGSLRLPTVLGTRQHTRLRHAFHRCLLRREHQLGRESVHIRQRLERLE